MPKFSFNIVLVVFILVGLLGAIPVRNALADCTAGTGGADDIVCDDDPNGVAAGDGDDSVTVQEGATVQGDGGTFNAAFDLAISSDGTGNDTIINDGTVTALGSAGDTGAYAVWDGTGNDIVVNNGLMEVSGDSELTAGVIDFGGNDLLVNTGTISTSNNTGDAFGVLDSSGNDVIVNLNTITALATADGQIASGISDVNGSNLIVNDGTIDAASTGTDGYAAGIASVDFSSGTGFAYTAIGESTVINNGTINASAPDGFAVGVDLAGGPFTIINNGTISGDTLAIFTDFGNDQIFLGNGSVTEGGSASIVTLDGSDTVTIGNGGVSYGISCSDISVTNVSQGSGATVIGAMLGGTGSDTLVFNLFTPSQDEFDAFGASNSDPAADAGLVQNIELNGRTYSFAQFENVRLGGVFTEGPNRLFDDGVVLAFASTHTAQGVDVCSGPMGFRAATIDFTQLQANANGQVFSAGNEGWFVKVFSIGANAFRVEVYDGNGVLQHDKFTFDPEVKSSGITIRSTLTKGSPSSVPTIVQPPSGGGGGGTP